MSTKKNTFFWIAPNKTWKSWARPLLWAIDGRVPAQVRERELEGKLKQEVETGGLFVFFGLFAIAFAPALFYLYFFDKT